MMLMFGPTEEQKVTRVRSQSRPRIDERQMRPEQSCLIVVMQTANNFGLGHAQCITAPNFVVVPGLEMLHNRDGDVASPRSKDPALLLLVNCIERVERFYRNWPNRNHDTWCS